ncbi:MAG: TatD family deoxyribonuclease [Bacteroidetes bacterium]|nr:TatD family deoxyribonuclease [Bacteroidota bacterium]
MILVDTHTHLYLPEFDSDRDETVARALKAGVHKMIMPNIDRGSFPSMMDAASRYPGLCIPMIGLHPTSVRDDFREELDFIEEKAASGIFSAIGETGIDLYWDKSRLEEQEISFTRHIEMAIRHSLPIVIHARDSFAEIFRILSGYRGAGLTGVFHAFTGTPADLRLAVDTGLHIGIGGIVTFRNSPLAVTISEADPGMLLLETDSPYLAPVPYRGRRNESAYLAETNERLAGIFGMTPARMAAITTENAVKLFRL